MSINSRITDDEMKYFQFKARQCFLLQKEDHEWNEFCRQQKCTCCSCQPMVLHKQTKHIGIQASTKAPIYLNRSSNVKTFQGKELPESLNDIKTKLEKIDLTLSSINVDVPKDNMQNNIPFGSKLVDNDSTTNFYTEQKKLLIRKSLMNSLQRLHSYAMQVSPRPISSPVMTKKNRSFFIPPDLQKQRIIARKAYLASLVNHPNVEKKKETHALNVKKKTVNKNNTDKPGNIHAKSRIFNISSKKQKPSIPKKKDETTLIQLEEKSESKDENIEKSIDNILEDLLHEEILALNRIRQRKIGNQVISSNPENDEDLGNTSIKECKSGEFEDTKREIHLHTLSPKSRSKIKQNPFFDFKMPRKKNLKTLSCNQNQLEDGTNPIENSCNEENTIQNISKFNNTESSSVPNPNQIKDNSKSKRISASNECTVIYADPQLEEKVSKHRHSYWQYLEKIFRTSSSNFDPLTLSNMVAESLLDDCLVDICQELCDMPSSLVTDLYNQEFTPIM